MSSEPLRLFVLTRPTLWLAMGSVRLLPLCWLIAVSRLADTPPDPLRWNWALLACLAISATLWLAERRCSSKDRSYRQGLLVISASVSCGWTFFDTGFVVCAVVLVQ